MEPQTTPNVDDGTTTLAAEAAPEVDPLVTAWFAKIKEAKAHWKKFHDRVRHNRKVVRGIDDSAEANTSSYNKDRANLIQSTLTVVLSKVYAKNPEMSGEPTNKARDLRTFAQTLSVVTQRSLEDAKLKKQAKRSVRAAMTCAFGVLKLQYQRDMATDPIITRRIQDAQDNIRAIEAKLAQLEDPASRSTEETIKAELESLVTSLQQQPEVVAAEGMVLDVVRTERLLVDPAIEDIWDYDDADWMVEIVPMRKSKAQGLYKGFDLSSASAFRPGDADLSSAERRQMYSGQKMDGNADPIILVYECWNRVDNRIYTLVDGCNKQFAREPYTPKFATERWYPYYVLPFQSVDGEFVAQSLVDAVEKLQEEHNETREKYAELRRMIKPHYIVSGDLSDKAIEKRTDPALGELIVVRTDAGRLQDVVQQAAQMQLDPALFDTSSIRNDWEMVSGLQDAARSVVVQSKTATEAAISDQSLAARVSEFRDQIEDFLTEIAQGASELCLLAMEPHQVEQIMGAADPMTGQLPYAWPAQRTPAEVFNLIQMKIRAGSTAAPNKLQMQENWAKAMPLIKESIMVIRQIDSMGGDSTPERELLKETASRFDETIDVERFLPPKPPAPIGLPAPAGMPMGGAEAPLPEIPMEPAGVQVGGRVAEVPVQ